jgi:hypothetical protein
MKEKETDLTGIRTHDRMCTSPVCYHRANAPCDTPLLFMSLKKDIKTT